MRQIVLHKTFMAKAGTLVTGEPVYVGICCFCHRKNLVTTGIWDPVKVCRHYQEIQSIGGLGLEFTFRKVKKYFK